MQTSTPGSKPQAKKRDSDSGSILIDAVVSVMIFSTLGLAVLMLLGAGYRALNSADSELRSCLTQLQTSQKSLSQNQ